MIGTACLSSPLPKTLRIPLPNKQIPPPTPFLLQNTLPHKRKPEKKGDSWNQQQKRQYWTFLCHFEKQIQRISGKATWTLYKLMSQFVKTRNPNQCRIQHLRMLKEHGELKSLLASARRIFSAGLDYTNQEETLLRELLRGFQGRSTEGQSNNTDGSLQAIQEIKYDYIEDGPLRQRREFVEESQKKQNEDNIRTDMTYHDEENGENQQMIPAARSHWHPDHHQPNNFPPTHSQPFGVFPSIFPYADPFHFATPMAGFNMCPSQPVINQQSEWMECHQLFLSWTSKLKQLMEKS